jgi:hypothetical protein
MPVLKKESSMLTSRLAVTIVGVGLLLFSIAGNACAGASANETPQPAGEVTPGSNLNQDEGSGQEHFLPLVFHPVSPVRSASIPKINAPYFGEEIVLEETAVFWFGRVTPTENYTDVRIGYTATELFVHLNIFDRSVWYDPDPSPENLSSWDATTLFLYLNEDGNSGLDENSYRFVGQLNWWEPSRDNFQAAYKGNGGSWLKASLPFTTNTGWRGDAPNQDSRNDRGWRIAYRIPFTSIGLSGPPPQGTTWRLALAVHDRDDAIGTPIEDKRWPENTEFAQPNTWGVISFGIPSFLHPPGIEEGNVTIRHQLNGANVVDGMVGGGTDCGKGLNFFEDWGKTNYAGKDQINIQNQYDVADWPCFSKFYITFPLDSIPSGKAILSAQLTLYQFGSSGGGDFGEAPSSLIQVSTVNEDWDEATLTWNNAPLAAENVSQSWVDWVDPSAPIQWPGHARTWDVGRAVAEAYDSGTPLRLVFYSADSAMHSGKYFTSSDTQDWNQAGRPTLKVTWGEP